MQKQRKLVTINYSLTKDLSGRLEDYCERTGRTATSVLLQLILEFVEGDRSINVLSKTPIDGVRSSMQIRSNTLLAFDSKIESAGLPSKGLVIAALLTDFLNRSPKADIEERLTVPVPLPVDVVRLLADRAAIRGIKLADFVAEVVVSTTRPEPVKTRES